MDCTSVKPGVGCSFMSKTGCQFNGGTCHAIVDKCEGCMRAQEFPTGKYCLVFPDPAAKWRVGNCNMATNAQNGDQEETSKKINPLKASKRSQR